MRFAKGTPTERRDREKIACPPHRFDAALTAVGQNSGSPESQDADRNTRGVEISHRIVIQASSLEARIMRYELPDDEPSDRC
jgi:hypothetical protein